MDGTGNLYIADYRNHRIRKVDASGNISTVAGTGTPGFGGDGGAASAAMLNGPAGVAVDGAGNLYIADYRGHRIRKVDASGNISTIAGTGMQGFGGDGGLATAATLSLPGDLAVASDGNVYIADTANHRVRRVDASTGIISSIAGSGSIGSAGGGGGAATAARLNNPFGVALDDAGNLYIADRNNHRVHKVDASTGDISTVAGTGTAAYGGDGGAATSATLFVPRKVAVDGSGNLYIADTSNHRIRRVDAATGIISTVAGTGHGRLRRRWRRRHRGRRQLAHRGCGGWQRQPLHRGHRQPPHPQGGRCDGRTSPRSPARGAPPTAAMAAPPPRPPSTGP